MVKLGNLKASNSICKLSKMLPFSSLPNSTFQDNVDLIQNRPGSELDN